MGVVLDFEAVTLDGETAGHVPYSAFDTNGYSPVYLATLRSSVANEYRPGPNDVTVLNSAVRLGLSEAECLAAEWGASLAVAEDLATSGIPLYIQFKRSMATGAEIALTDCIAVIADGFLTLEGAAGSGNTTSAGEGTASHTNPAAGEGNTNSAGTGSATATGAPAAQPASGAGNTTSAGEGAGTANNPSAGTTYFLRADGTYGTTQTGAAYEETPTVFSRAMRGTNTAYDNRVLLGAVAIEGFNESVVTLPGGTVDRTAITLHTAISGDPTTYKTYTGPAIPAGATVTLYYWVERFTDEEETTHFYPHYTAEYPSRIVVT